MVPSQEIQEELERLRELNASLTVSLKDREKIISEQKRKIRSLYQQLETLNVYLSELHASEGWRLLLVYYRIRDKILPAGSGRHKKLKKIVNFLRGKKEDQIVLKNHSQRAGSSSMWKRPIQIEAFDLPHFSHPKVSIIIPAYNGWEMNYRCLRSIWENTDGVSYEVIFADDVSTDETQHVQRYINNIIHIRNEKNLGFLQNCNHAAKFAKGEYLHFLNNDTVVTEHWLSSLAELMDKDPVIGMAGSKLIYPNDLLQEAGGIIWQDASGWNYGHSQDPDAPEFNYVKEVDYISGASIMVRKSLWEKLGGFDARYEPAYCEDSDLAFAIRRLGYKVMYQPLSEVIHFEGFSHGKDADVKKEGSIKSYQQVNAVKFAEKWRSVLESQFPNGVNAFWTRDRSHGKPTVVVIDHYVPQFDKDAGSRTTFQYLELFTELGLNVKFIPDNFYRNEPYTTVLQQKGIEVLYGDHWRKNWMKWLKENDEYIDFIFLNRPHISLKYMEMAKNHLRGKVFYYTHDLHFYRELMQYELGKDPQILKSSNQWKELEYSLFAQSDVVLTPSGKEKAIIRQDFPEKPIEVMPAFFYPSIPDPIADFSARKDILFVGGFTHAPNVDGVLWFAKEVMPILRQKDPGIRLIVVGSNAPTVISSLQSPDILIKGFVTDEELEKLYGSVRLAVIPLRYGAGLKGKTVEAIAKGLPVVSTSFGVEGMEGISHFLQAYDNANDFAEAILRLYPDNASLARISGDSVAYARKYFTKASAAVFFSGLFGI